MENAVGPIRRAIRPPPQHAKLVKNAGRIPRSAGDIAQFDDEQQWTYTEIGTQILLFLDCTNCTTTKNNSTLSYGQIRNLIMEEFIVSGLSYCDVWDDELKFCENLGNQTFKDKVVRDTYIKLVVGN